MVHHVLVVEGAHDAAFFGRLLASRGFAIATNLNQVPDFWIDAIPTKFPVRRDLTLERVINFPEIHLRRDGEDTFGIVVANGDGGLLEALRVTLDVRDATEFATVSVVLDTDWQDTEADRFATFIEATQAWNEAGVADRRPGFPLAFPAAPGQIRQGTPSVGIYLFPGNGAQGALESILLSCAEHHFPVLHDQAQALLDVTHAAYPIGGADPFKKSRKASGSAKARCGIIANALKPGSSLAVSIRDASWLPLNENALPSIRRAADFLDCLLAQ